MAKFTNDGVMLASLLRECASIVEQNETSPLLFTAVESLNAYAENKSKQNHGHNNGMNHNTHHNGGADGNANANANANGHGNTGGANNGNAGVPMVNPAKPAFQRPINTASNLIANGWLEQQRKSAFRMVWKQILASLVEARRPGEDTTLWIQREAVRKLSDGTVKTSLDALHQIPMKWLLSVRYLDDYGDFRFCLKVYNVPEEFVFRTPDEDSCKEWVATLTSAKEASQKPKVTRDPSFPDLLSEENKATSTHRPHPTAPPAPATDANHTHTPTNNNNNNNMFPNLNMKTGSPQKKKPVKKSLKELIAIAHGAGYNTRGMERADLEKIANHFAPVSEKNYTPQQPPISKTPPTNTNNNNNNNNSENNSAASATYNKAAEEEANKAKAFTEEEKIKQQLENMRVHQDQQRRERNKKMQEQLEKDRVEEESRKERTKKMQEEFDRDRAEEAKKNEPGQIPQKWQEPWASQNANGGRANTTFQNNHSRNTAPPAPPPPPRQQPRPNNRNNIGTPPRNADPTSPMNQKYFKQMSSAKISSEQDEQTAISSIKRNVLMSWALIPPQYNMLRPINQLLTTIQKVFPPFSNVKPHDYFKKWKAISRDELFDTTKGSYQSNSVPDEAKLKKAHRRLKVLLHPDRLPKDLDGKQKFVCKMLWDVTNDALEEYMKNKDDLDWINR